MILKLSFPNHEENHLVFKKVIKVFPDDPYGKIMVCLLFGSRLE